MSGSYQRMGAGAGAARAGGLRLGAHGRAWRRGRDARAPRRLHRPRLARRRHVVRRRSGHRAGAAPHLRRHDRHRPALPPRRRGPPASACRRASCATCACRSTPSGVLAAPGAGRAPCGRPRRSRAAAERCCRTPCRLGGPTNARPDPLVQRRRSARSATPDTRLDALAARLGVSDRDLRRRFNRTVGYGPKRLDRILRFQPLPGVGATATATPIARFAWRPSWATPTRPTSDALACASSPGSRPRELLATA